ncbi:MAG: alpha/beta hydrolase [Promethearchaeota archaeon]
MEPTLGKTYVEDGEPFVLENPQSRTSVICLHGFSATPFEIKPVAIALHHAGYHVSGPALLGHALSPEEVGLKIMGKAKFQEWIEPIRAEVTKLRDKFENVFIYGQSMGGAIALALACEGIIDAVATTGPAIRLPIAAHFFSPILGMMNKNIKKGERKPGAPENITYTSRPSKAIRQLILLGKYVRSHLGRISCPVLVCHSKRDDTVPIRVPSIIEKNVSSKRVEVKWFNDSGHTYPLDIQSDDVISTIVDFFKNI